MPYCRVASAADKKAKEYQTRRAEEDDSQLLARCKDPWRIQEFISELRAFVTTVDSLHREGYEEAPLHSKIASVSPINYNLPVCSAISFRNVRKSFRYADGTLRGST